MPGDFQHENVDVDQKPALALAGKYRTRSPEGRRMNARDKILGLLAAGLIALPGSAIAGGTDKSAPPSSSKASNANPLSVPPAGFVLQTLDVTDGLIARPKDWYYQSGSSSGGRTWIIAKEDPAKGSYETGMRIQLITGIQKNTGQTPEALVRNFLAGKATSTKPLSVCSQTDIGFFERLCVEVIENLALKAPAKPFHIAYTGFWATNGGDLAVITTFGAPADQWADVRHTAEVMNAFRLIGPNLGKSLQ
jgi:hypothetical protein